MFSGANLVLDHDYVKGKGNAEGKPHLWIASKDHHQMFERSASKILYIEEVYKNRQKSDIDMG